MAWLRRINRLFLFTVILPTVLAVIYFGLIASDIYISESRFMVRSPQRQSQSGILGSLLQGTGFSRSQDDAYSVQDYILSRDALKELDDKLAVRKAFSSRSVDFLNRFPTLEWDESFESLFRYYKRRVSVELDSTSSITALKVSAFTAADAARINDLLLQMSERLVNALNERARQDLIGYATSEVQNAEKSAKEAALMLSSYRNRQSVVDPEKQSALQLQGVSKLQEELIATRTQLAQVRSVTPNNPQIPLLRNRADTLQVEIDAETAKVTGGSKSLAGKAAIYERLALERTFADRQLASALISLETARNEAQRQQLYLERLVQPNTPDYPVEPRRIRSVIMVFVLGLLAWGILSLLVASVREHLD